MDTENIQLEQNVVFPSRGAYPFEDMDPGDSFFLPDKDKANAARVASIRFRRKHQPNWNFKMRKVDGGWRLWRVV